MDNTEREFTLMISEEKLRKVVREEMAKWYKEEVIDPQVEVIRKMFNAEMQIRGEDEV